MYELFQGNGSALERSIPWGLKVPIPPAPMEYMATSIYYYVEATILLLFGPIVVDYY